MSNRDAGAEQDIDGNDDEDGEDSQTGENGDVIMPVDGLPLPPDSRTGMLPSHACFKVQMATSKSTSRQQ